MAKQPACRSGGCRVCLKSFKDGDYSRVCSGCKFKVCEDCATSYTKIGEDEVNAYYSCIYNSVHNRVYLRNCAYGQGRKNGHRFLSRKPRVGKGNWSEGTHQLQNSRFPSITRSIQNHRHRYPIPSLAVRCFSSRTTTTNPSRFQ